MTKLIAIFIGALLLISNPSFASGGDGGAGAGGAGGGDGGGDYAQDSNYAKGKRILKKKLLCKSCPLAGTKLKLDNLGLIKAKLAPEGELAGMLSEDELMMAQDYIAQRMTSATRAR